MARARRLCPAVERFPAAGAPGAMWRWSPQPTSALPPNLRWPGGNRNGHACCRRSDSAAGAA